MCKLTVVFLLGDPGMTDTRPSPLRSRASAPRAQARAPRRHTRGDRRSAASAEGSKGAHCTPPTSSCPLRISSVRTLGRRRLSFLNHARLLLSSRTPAAATSTPRCGLRLWTRHDCHGPRFRSSPRHRRRRPRPKIREPTARLRRAGHEKRLVRHLLDRRRDLRHQP